VSDPKSDVTARLDEIAAKLRDAHDELEAAMEQRRAALERIEHLQKLRREISPEDTSARAPAPGESGGEA